MPKVPPKGGKKWWHLSSPRRGMGSEVAAKETGMGKVETREKTKVGTQRAEDGRLEAEALAWCERLGRKLDRKKSRKRFGDRYENRG